MIRRSAIFFAIAALFSFSSAHAAKDYIATMFKAYNVVMFCATERTGLTTRQVRTDEYAAHYIDIGQYERCVAPRLIKAGLIAPRLSLRDYQNNFGSKSIAEFTVALVNFNM